MTNDEFYIGYTNTVGKETKQFLKKRIGISILTFFLLGITILFTQDKFYPSLFEYLNTKSYNGILWQYPYPHLELTNKTGRYLLVNPGKHGIKKTINGYEVRLLGKLISRDNEKMLEVVPDSIQKISNKKFSAKKERVIGRKTLIGEIVDSKCFYGVMNPGHLKTHKACAILCLKGGIPAVLFTKSDTGGRYYLLLTTDGKPLTPMILDKVAVPLEITGIVSKLDNFDILKVENIKILQNN